MANSNERAGSQFDLEEVVYNIPESQRRGDLKTILNNLAAPLETTPEELYGALRGFVAVRTRDVKPNLSGRWSIYGVGYALNNNLAIVLRREEGGKYFIYVEPINYRAFDKATQSMVARKGASITGEAESYNDARLSEGAITEEIRRVESKVKDVMK